MTAVLSGRGLDRHYRVTTVLDRVAIDMAPGQTVAVIGQSGSGKSTLLHCLSGIVDPQCAGCDGGEPTPAGVADGAGPRPVSQLRGSSTNTGMVRSVFCW